MIEIRKAAEADIDSIIEIENEAITPAWTHGMLLNEIYRDDAHFELACEGAKIIGFYILREISGESELLQIAVAEAARRCGIGGELMKACLVRALKNRISKVHLEVRSKNGAAISMYEKHGFINAGKRKSYYTQPEDDAIIMTKKIPAGAENDNTVN